MRLSSLEDPCTVNSEYGKAPSTILETVATGTATVKAYVSESSNLKLEKIPEAVEKPQVKESSKGFRRLLKFGRKNHSSSSGERNGEADNASMNGFEADDNETNTVSSSEGNLHYTQNTQSKDTLMIVHILYSFLYILLSVVTLKVIHLLSFYKFSPLFYLAIVS